MKRMISMFAIAMMLILIAAPVTVLAVPGEDAHSDTMVVEADGESVESKQSEEPEVQDVEVSEEELEAELAKAADTEDSAAEDYTEEVENEPVSTGPPIWIYIAAGGCALLLAIIIIYKVKRL